MSTKDPTLCRVFPLVLDKFGKKRYNTLTLNKKDFTMLHTFTAQAVNTNAKAKVLVNKKLGTVRVVVAFNVTQTNAKGNFLFPQQAKCAFVSSDCDATEVLQQIAKAAKVLNTNNIQFVS